MREILRLTLLGTPQIMLGNQLLTGFATQKAQALLFYLAVTTPIGATQAVPHSREAIATLLWGEMTDSQARQNLRAVLPDLRRLVGDHVRVERQTIAFDPTSAHWLDVAALRQGLTPGRSPLDLATRQAAIELYQGEFLHGFYVRDAPIFEAWVLAQREQLHTLLVNALAGLVNEYTQRGDAPAALATNHRLLVLEPWSEPVHRQQMALLAQTGERSAALAQYEICQQILAAEFGIEPLAETTALYEQIRAGASKGQAAVAPPQLVAQSSNFKDQSQDKQTDSKPRTQDSGLPLQVAGHNLPTRTKLYGRQPELTRLQKYIVEDGCRLVGIFGMGGQGKTALAAAFVRGLAELTSQPGTGVNFQRIIWQSLLNAPPLAEIMQEWLYVLSEKTVTSLPTSLDQQLSLLLTQLRLQRCLLVLDNLESILQEDGRGGYYRVGYEVYSQLVRCLVEGEHQSCLLLTSREQPQDLIHLEEDTPIVRFVALTGLPVAAGQAKLQARGLSGDPADLAALVQHYSGNPLALKLVAETVQSLFDGDIAAFLQAETLVFDDIREVLDQQFVRLRPLERELMVWLAIVGEPVTYTTLRNLLAQPPAPRLVIEAMRSLQRRSLLEKYEEGFGLQNVVLEYTIDWFVDGICTELVNGNKAIGHPGDNAYNAHSVPSSPSFSLSPSFLNGYALVLAQAKDYIRIRQTRLLLQPVANRLLDQLGVRGAEQQLQRQLARLRTAPPAPGYAAANLFHLLLQLDLDLQGYDFSHLYLRQVYLRGVSLRQVNFAGANLTGTLFTEHLGRIFTVAFSPDGRLLAAGTREGAIHLWRTADQQLAQVIQAHNHAIVDLAFALHPAVETDAALVVASAGEDQAVGLWQVAKVGDTRQAFATAPSQRGQLLEGHRQTVIGVSFSADGRRLASVDMDGQVRVWERATGQLAYSFNCHLPKFRLAAFSRDGHTLAIGSNDGAVYLWQVTGVPDLVLTGHTRDVTAIAFSPDGRMLASGGGDGRICLWALPQGQLQQVLDATAGFVSALAFGPDGKTLASSHWDRAVRLWAVSTAQDWASFAHSSGQGQLYHTLIGHTHVIRAVAFSPDGRLLASGGSDQTVRVWDAQTGQPLYMLSGHHHTLNAIALSPDGTKLAAVGYDQLVHLWSWRNRDEATAHRALRGHRGLLHTVGFSHNGHLIASAGRDPAIYIWDAASGQLRNILHGHKQDIYRIAFHPDDRWLATGSADGTIRFWNLDVLAHEHARPNQPEDILYANTGMIYSVIFSPDGRILASAGVGPTIRLWDMTKVNRPELVDARKTVQEQSEQEIVALAFSADGARLACGGTNLIHLWEWPSGESPVILRYHVDWVMALAFSPDGAILASASEDRTVCLWDVAGGTLRAVLHGHTEGVSSVCFSVDGAYVLSSSADGTIKFWDSQTGNCVNTLFVEGPYAEMNITDITGVTEAQKAALKILGAVEV